MRCFTTDKKLFFALAFILLLRFSSNAADDFSALKMKYAPLGQLIVTQFVSAPFPHPARANGHTYDSQFYSAAEHYSNSDVAIFIPKHFRATDKIDFVVHFHGWRHTVATTLPEYRLIEQFAASGKNAILIVPQGPYDAPDSFGGKLEDTNGFAHFMFEAMVKVSSVSGVFSNLNSNTVGIGNIILSGHSGGYHVMAEIVDHGGLSEKIREVWLFDALYGNAENFVAWQKTENGRLLDIYTDHGGTKEETENLMASYQTNGVSFFASEDTNAAPENLRTNQIVFLHTDMVHDDVVGKRGTFEEFLTTSCLNNKVPSFVYVRGNFEHRGPITWTNGMMLKDAIGIGVFTVFSPPEIVLVHTDGSRERYKWTVNQPLTNNPTLKIGDQVICPWDE